ncbi:UbiA prenyltransferase [Lentithecium fluviatile CBS 122367]|uniref:UbiA prenyltransferase n=1 Tax=Lentithecium fluviatile CBS 122367 TaxID=1168545 RepID=A0A6G1IIM5_9PLEO|nr:UbiA prenyltransferase [Lentithecium fluviatile CBS 122367]
MKISVMDQPKQRTLFFHLRTLWLFTRSDLKTVVIPQTIFGLVVALSGPLLTTNPSPNPLDFLRNIPKSILYIWINLLNEVMSNQRCPDSITEDSINKPWRPLPSQRLTPENTRHMQLYIIPTIYGMSLVLGGSEAAVALMVFSHMYNELDGGQENWLIRNVLNACGLSCFSVGAAIVVAGYGRYSITEDAYTWIGILAAVIATTVQAQDLADVEGDRARNRKTLMLVYGEGVTRWSIAVPVLFWSVACCWYWSLDFLWYLPSVLVGAVMAGRAVLMRGKAADEVTWKLWCLWMMVLYSLPLLKRVSSSRGIEAVFS